MTQKELKLNIGCGPNGQFEGYINIDNSPSVWLAKFPFIKKVLYEIGVIGQHQYTADWLGVIKCDASEKLHYGNETVDKIYTSHFLEHIPRARGQHFIAECFRVLKRGGVMRLVAPDLLWHAERYVERTRALLETTGLADDRIAHDTFLNTVYGAYLNKRRYGAEHCYMYDLPSLISILKDVGFQNICKREYREGDDKELASHDSRPGESLHLEIRK